MAPPFSVPYALLSQAGLLQLAANMATPGIIAEKAQDWLALDTSWKPREDLPLDLLCPYAHPGSTSGGGAGRFCRKTTDLF